jgi:hypothetical protein
MLHEVILSKNYSFVLVHIPAPYTMHFPDTFSAGRPIGKPHFPAKRVKNAMRSQTSGHREGACPYGNRGWVARPKQEGLECGSLKRIDQQI